MAITAAVLWTASLAILGVGGGALAQEFVLGSALQEPGLAPIQEQEVESVEFSLGEKNSGKSLIRQEKPETKISDENKKASIKPRNSREILVKTRSASEGTEVLSHPAVVVEIDQREALRSGTSTVSETVARSLTWRSIVGNSGLGSVSTKLNVATRGVNPRFSSRTTILLDEVPMATAPYGRPQQLMFPLSMGSIAKIQAFPGGNTLRFGPHNAGGVINLVSAAIPERPSDSISIQANHWGEIALGAAHAGYYGPLGVRIEYLPRFGQSFREHSDLSVQGALLKLQGKFGERWTVSMMNHAYWEDVEIPGGMSREAFDQDPRQSIRSNDRFSGWRVGSSFNLRYRLGDHQSVQTIAYVTHTDRKSQVAKGVDGEAEVLRLEPRSFDAVGLEPRLRLQLNHRGKAWHELWFGFRVAYEQARMLGQELSLVAKFPGPYLRREQSMIRAVAGYVEDRLHFLDNRMELSAGIRIESTYANRKDYIADQSVNRGQWAPLPAVSWLFRPFHQWSIFANYGRSFAPPQFLQLSLAGDSKQIRGETTDSAEVGTRALELLGLDLQLSLWFKATNNLTDISFEGIEQPGASEAFGSEASAKWSARSVVDSFRGIEIGVAHVWTRARLVTGPLQGNRLPWYPVHRISGNVAYRSDLGLRGAIDVEYSGSYFTDYAGTRKESFDASIGMVPAFTRVGLQVGYEKSFLRRVDLGLFAGVQNLFDEKWYTRTDDRNAGILPQQPRTFFLNLRLCYR